MFERVFLRLPKRGVAALSIAAAAVHGAAPSVAQEGAGPAVDESAINRCLVDDPALFQQLRRLAQTRSETGQRVRMRELPEYADACATGDDPHTYPEELALPMPCGRRMIFRRVLTPAENPLAHEIGFFGDIDAETAGDAYLLSTSPWNAPVSGPFVLENGLRAYYVGKYEVTEAQWKIYEDGLLEASPLESADPASELCQEFETTLAGPDGRGAPRPAKVAPAGGLDWHGAVAFSRVFTDWLVERDRAAIEAGERPSLPWRNGSTGFVRLPTEAEWEFAARGGDVGRESRSKRWPDIVEYDRSVDPPQRLQRQPTSLEEIAFVEGAGARSLLDGVGRRAPNSFGLYDVVGNVEEISLDLFRLVRPDGLHGLVGGYVARGGSSLTPSNTVGVGARREIPLAAIDQAAPSSTTGARLAISAPVFAQERATDGSWRGGGIDTSFTEDALRARQALTAGATMSPTPDSDLIAEIAELEGDTADLASLDRDTLGRRLAELRVLLDRSNARLADAENEGFRDRAVATIAIAWAIRQSGQRLFVGRNQIALRLDKMQREGSSAAEIAQETERRMNAVRRINGELDSQYKIYVEGVQELSELDPKRFKLIFESALAKIQARGAGAFGAAPSWLQDHVAEASVNNGEITREMRRDWLFTVDEFRSRRHELFGEIK